MTKEEIQIALMAVYGLNCIGGYLVDCLRCRETPSVVEIQRRFGEKAELDAAIKAELADSDLGRTGDRSQVAGVRNGNGKTAKGDG